MSETCPAFIEGAILTKSAVLNAPIAKIISRTLISVKPIDEMSGDLSDELSDELLDVLLKINSDVIGISTNFI